MNARLRSYGPRVTHMQFPPSALLDRIAVEKRVQTPPWDSVQFLQQVHALGRNPFDVPFRDAGSRYSCLMAKSRHASSLLKQERVSLLSDARAISRVFGRFIKLAHVWHSKPLERLTSTVGDLLRGGKWA